MDFAMRIITEWKVWRRCM